MAGCTMEATVRCDQEGLDWEGTLRCDYVPGGQSAVEVVAPELLAGLGVILLHKWKHNMLLSIGGGTALYLVLIHLVF